MAKPHKNIVFYLLSVLYGIVTEARNRMFDRGILKQHSFDLPIISIGNLAVGGTGKTPHTEFIIQQLSKNIKIAVLSRGYKRATKGFVLAGKESTAKTIGDESFQIFSKFPEVTVAVDEKRVRGIGRLMEQCPEIKAIILDDAYQHRHVKAGLSVLLTDYSALYADDFILPYGNLREHKNNSNRADIIVVTKCPDEIQHEEFSKIEQKLNPATHQQLFFSRFEYGNIYPVFSEGKNLSLEKTGEGMAILLVTGIVSPTPLLNYLKNFTTKITTKFFPDHHDFSKNELYDIEKEFEKMTGFKIILTTEKDAARLKSNPYLTEKLKKNLYALPLEVKISNNEQDKFIQKIQDYVRKNSGNR